MTHLSTGKSNNVSELLEQFSDSFVLLILVSISPRHQKTGLLEEQGAWVLSFWSKMIEAVKDIVGCRVLWNTIFFAVDQSKVGLTESVLERMLLQLKSPILKSICVTMETKGSVQDKIKALDTMQLETSSELNFNTIEMIKTRLVDGEVYKP
ncbi:MAG: hypothetical protein BBJ57_01625 [Desulfobacterales bacterium PC51MH44]|nr:MAG: hypothetical protein BBJ57_01625 [Desulfobacterales bacterium PC51MH44]